MLLALLTHAACGPGFAPAAEAPHEVAAAPGPGPVSPSPVPTWQELEAAGAVIGQITVVVGDVFDTRVEGENAWLYRTANKLHIDSKPATIRQQLLFESGDRFEQRKLEESERILRANKYLYEALVVPVAYHDGVVDIEVRTRDTWTLNPGFNFGRQGGENKIGAQIQEQNLLGNGQELTLEWRSDVDRESVELSFYDPHFLHSRNRLALSYIDADDGETQAFRFERPFYALDARWAAGVALSDSSRVDSRYVEGDEIGEFEHREEFYEVRGGRSRGLRDGRVTRWTYGLSYERDRFAVVPGSPPGGPLPEDRELLYPWVGVEFLEDRFEERRNQDQIRRTEDVLVGLRAGAQAGYASGALGSDRDALLLLAYVQNGVDLAPGRSVFGSTSVSGRIEDEGLRNGLLNAEGRFYLRTSRRGKFYASVAGTLAEDLDAEYQLLLGGDNGLRGYPLRYQAGTARALLTLEQRYYTDWYPFRLFHVGAAAFFDMGRTWGRDVTGAESLGLLRDVGVGLRFGSSRSSFGNVIHVDLAFPLDRGGERDIDAVQLLVTTKGSF